MGQFGCVFYPSVLAPERCRRRRRRRYHVTLFFLGCAVHSDRIASLKNQNRQEDGSLQPLVWFPPFFISCTVQIFARFGTKADSLSHNLWRRRSMKDVNTHSIQKSRRTRAEFLFVAKIFLNRFYGANRIKAMERFLEGKKTFLENKVIIIRMK